MLAETAEPAFSRAGLAVRAQARRLSGAGRARDGEARLLTRNGNDCAASFPEVARAVAALPFDRLVLDGEVVALDDAWACPASSGCRAGPACGGRIDIRHAAVETPVTYYAFDLLGFEDFDLRPLPLTTRKALLQRVLPPLGALRYLEHVDQDGEALYREAERLGLEGMVAKKAPLALQGGPLAGLAQGPLAADRRLRGGGLHRAQGLARRLRRACIWPST